MGPRKYTQDVVVYTSNGSTQEVETGQLGIQECPWICIKFKASLGYILPCLKHLTEENQLATYKPMDGTTRRHPVDAVHHVL